MFFPSTACFVQKNLGAKRAACFDVSAACSGFLYAIEIAQQFITSCTYDTVLVIGADKLSSIVDWTDRNTCVLFGDGAGRRDPAQPRRFARSDHHLHGQRRQLQRHPLHARRRLPSSRHRRRRSRRSCNTIKMSGKEIYKQAVTAMLTAANAALEGAGLTPDDLACIIPHQANMRIIEAVAEPDGRADRAIHGQPGPLRQHQRGGRRHRPGRSQPPGRMKLGDYVLLIVFGGGLTWASSVIQW